MAIEGFFGAVCIVVGALIVLIFMGDFLLRILGALLGIYIINYGVRLLGKPPLHWTVVRIWSSRYRP